MIKWPAEWDPQTRSDPSWPSAKSGRSIADGRTWDTLNVNLQGTTIAQLTLQLGRRKPVAPEEEVRRRLLEFDLTARQYHALIGQWGPAFYHADAFPRLYGKTFNELKTGRSEWVSEDEFRKHVQGLSGTQYQAIRASLGPNFPALPSLRAIYGKPYLELRDGPMKPVPVSEEQLRGRLQGLGNREYGQRRKSWGPGWPCLDDFPKVYGKTFREIRDGARRSDWVTKEVIRDTIQNLSTKEYGDQRRSLGPRFPTSRMFEKIYGQPYGEIRHGRRLNSPWASIDDVRRVSQGLSEHEYDDKKRSGAFGPNFPVVSCMRSVYGISYGEIRDGRKQKEWVPEDTFRQAIQGLTMKEYDAKREELGLMYPSSVHVRKVYGKSFGELRDGRKNGEWVPKEVFRERVRGLTREAYALLRSSWGSRWPSLPHIEKVYGESLSKLAGRR